MLFTLLPKRYEGLMNMHVVQDSLTFVSAEGNKKQR